MRPHAAHRSPAAATVQRVRATEPAPRRAAPTSEGSGKDPGELGGDSLAEVIGWWTTRVRSRLRAGRGTRRGGGRSSRVQRCGGAVSRENCGRGRGRGAGLPGSPGRRRPTRSGRSGLGSPRSVLAGLPRGRALGGAHSRELEGSGGASNRF